LKFPLNRSKDTEIGPDVCSKSCFVLIISIEKILQSWTENNDIFQKIGFEGALWPLKTKNVSNISI